MPTKEKLGGGVSGKLNFRRFFNGEYFDPFHEKIDKLQAHLLFRQDKNFLNLLKSSDDVRHKFILSKEDLSRLKSSSSFDLLTYKAILALASYGELDSFNNIKESVKNSLEARMRLQRVGIEVATFGFGLPMVALQMPPEIGIPAFLGLRGIYLSTIGKAMWKNRNRAGNCDAILVGNLYKLIDKELSQIKEDPRTEAQYRLDARAFESAIHTEYIEELWGLAPEISTILALFVTGQFPAALVNLGLVGVFRGGLRIIKNNKHKLQSLIDSDSEIPQIIATAGLKDIFSVAAIVLSFASNNPSLSASLAVGTTQVAGAELTKSSYRTQKPPHENTYRKLNQLLSFSIIFLKYRK